ncbi:serine hydrolase [Oscillatoria salina]|uniref:serine hydrolase n=1 Tax=Oscillatoria salina TaxID=331517 RepID=UPI001CCAC6A3|nr:serine hydrolase [Oscillatoria salina]MBZ8182705.1 serine hydrolase [Oscillatoria salina IIICB1]
MKRTVIRICLILLLAFPLLSLNATASTLVSPESGHQLKSTTQMQLALAETSDTTPTQFWWLQGVSPDQIKDKLKQGYRIVDLEVESTNPYRFSTAMVKNEGIYAKKWWWYYGLTSSAVKEKLSQNKARIIDLQVYRVNGQKRYAVVLVSNTGSDAKAWWYYTDLSFDEMMAKARDNNARLVDLETYVVGNKQLFSGVMIRNTGADRKAWWVYSNKSPAFISSKLQENNARLIDIEKRGNNTFTVIMERSEGQGWWWYYGKSAAQVNELWRQNGARIFDIEPYTVNGQKRFAVLMLNNSNALTTRIGEMLRDNTNGAVGLHLQRTNGQVLASLQSDRVFYPASTIKVLEHLHAMRAVAAGDADLDATTLRVYPDVKDSCSERHSGQNFNSETLREALEKMMKSSNNQSTNAIQELFGNGDTARGREVINRMAHNVVGMSNDTAINHKFACGGPNNNPANQLTLKDITLLYQQIATNSNVLDPKTRTTFYQLMLGKTNNLFNFVETVIDDEASKIGVTGTDLQSFKSQIEMAYKAGNIPYNSQINSHISIAGWIEIPFKNRTQIVPRQYTFGIFVDEATQNSVNLASVTAELLREEIRAALKTF